MYFNNIDNDKRQSIVNSLLDEAEGIYFFMSKNVSSLFHLNTYFTYNIGLYDYDTVCLELDYSYDEKSGKVLTVIILFDELNEELIKIYGEALGDIDTYHEFDSAKELILYLKRIYNIGRYKDDSKYELSILESDYGDMLDEYDKLLRQVKSYIKYLNLKQSTISLNYTYSTGYTTIKAKTKYYRGLKVTIEPEKRVKTIKEEKDFSITIKYIYDDYYTYLFLDNPQSKKKKEYSIYINKENSPLTLKEYYLKNITEVKEILSMITGG